MLLLLSAFTSIKDVAKDYCGAILALAVKQRFDNHSRIAEVTCPCFLLHGKNDTIVAFKHSLALIAQCGSLKMGFYFPEKMSHNSFLLEEDILRPILSFMESLRLTNRLESENPYRFFQQKAEHIT